jgi:hypothetical protein
LVHFLCISSILPPLPTAVSGAPPR